jgi:mannose-1-phosphate guanylyltransferase
MRTDLPENSSSSDSDGAHTWAVVLAAGEGTRLRSLTTTATGEAVPKQFCSLRGGPTLLHEALSRAHAVAPAHQVCAVVAEQHRLWWTPALQDLEPGNTIVQPANRGTAHGILLPLLHIAARDPDAVVVLLPADHHVLDENTLAQSLRRAATLARKCNDSVLLLGAEPDHADPELGYILPNDGATSELTPVRQFVEKPAPTHARELLEQGALWNIFIIAATARALLQLFKRDHADTFARMQTLIGDSATRHGRRALADLYQNLRSIDFSRDVLETHTAWLRVLPVPQCGWSDLGTPQRVAETLLRLPDSGRQRNWKGPGAFINLAHQHSLLFAARGGAVQMGYAS